MVTYYSTCTCKWQIASSCHYVMSGVYGVCCGCRDTHELGIELQGEGVGTHVRGRVSTYMQASLTECIYRYVPRNTNTWHSPLQCTCEQTQWCKLYDYTHHTNDHTPWYVASTMRVGGAEVIQGQEEEAESGGGEEGGWRWDHQPGRPWARRLGRLARVHPHLCRLRCRSRQCVALPISDVREWRRYVYMYMCTMCVAFMTCGTVSLDTWPLDAMTSDNTYCRWDIITLEEGWSGR